MHPGPTGYWARSSPRRHSCSTATTRTTTAGLRLCDLADRYLSRDAESAWFWRQKNQVTRCRLLYRNGEHHKATRLLDETDHAIRQMHAGGDGLSAEAIDVVLGIANEIRASIAATAGDLSHAQVWIMESLVCLAERDPVRHAYAYLSASRIYAAMGGENARMASRYASLAIDEFAEYGHAFEGRARNQRARSLVSLGRFEDAEDELNAASDAIARVENAAERAFATADHHLTEARLELARARMARSPAAEKTRWARIEQVTRAALAITPIPDRIRADAQIRLGQAVLKLRPRSAKAVEALEEGIALAARADRVRIVAVGHLALAEHFHGQGDALKALTHLELAQDIVGSSSSEAIDRWANQLAGSIDQPVRIPVRGRKYKEVMSDFQTRLKDYYVGISNGSEEVFRARSGLGRSEFFRSSYRGRSSERLSRATLRAAMSDTSSDAWLSQDPLPEDPVAVLKGWLDEAFAAREQANPHAVSLATVDPDGRPSARMVLCNGIDTERGAFVMYTNRESRKGRAIAAHPHAAIVFYWGPQNRQARVEGRVERTPDAECDAYFATRPVDAQVGAWASRQSEPIASRAALIERVDDEARRLGVSLEAREPAEVPRPPHWGGFTLVADRVELWVSRPARIHDRAEWVRDLSSREGERDPRPLDRAAPPALTAGSGGDAALPAARGGPYDARMPDCAPGTRGCPHPDCAPRHRMPACPTPPARSKTSSTPTPNGSTAETSRGWPTSSPTDASRRRPTPPRSRPSRDATPCSRCTKAPPDATRTTARPTPTT